MANWTMLLEEETEKYESLLESLAVAQVAADTTKTESAYKKARELRTAVKAASWNIIEMKLEIKMAAIAWATNDSGGFGPPRPAQERGERMMNVYRYKTTYEGSTISKDYTFDAVDDHAAVAHVCERERQDNLDSDLAVQELGEYGETTIGDGNLEVVRR